MTPELHALALAGLWQIVQYVLMSVPANLELGTAKTLGPRDQADLMDGLSIRTARLHRALSNHFEGLVLFTIAVVVVVLGGKSSALTTYCAWAFVVARILYVPAYWLGWNPWRTLIWAVGFCATALMLIASVF